MRTDHFWFQVGHFRTRTHEGKVLKYFGVTVADGVVPRPYLSRNSTSLKRVMSVIQLIQHLTSFSRASTVFPVARFSRRGRI